MKFRHRMMVLSLLSAAVAVSGTVIPQSGRCRDIPNILSGSLLANAAEADWYTLAEDGRSLQIRLPQEINEAAWSLRLSDDQAFTLSKEEQSNAGASFILTAASGHPGDQVTITFEDYLEGRSSVLSVYRMTVSLSDDGHISVSEADPAWFVLDPETNHLDVWMYVDDRTGYEWTFDTNRDYIYNQDTVFEAIDGDERKGYYHTCFCAENPDWEEKQVSLTLFYGTGVFRSPDNRNASVRTFTLRITEDKIIDVLSYSEKIDYQTYRGNGE